ncbi:MAG: hypothetical protein PSV22_05880 [Pseudolabrys sp.]|nr:hypothetical protein [Pseudolabrys sp.]
MARKKGLKIPGVSLSVNRALGVTNLKRKVARTTGIPTTQAGRDAKVGRILAGRGCVVPIVGGLLIVAGAVVGAIVVATQAQAGCWD